MEGVINIYKEADWTSSDVVNKLKGVLHQRRIGHGGTLDPDAQGVLPVLTGNATRLFDYMTAFKKTYVARVRFGAITDTQDASGTILEERAVKIDNQDILNALPSFTGNIKQIPPMYSAIHINGQRLYDLARKGVSVELEPREVFVEKIEMVSPLENGECSLRITCSKGTYIRTICHDLGLLLGCGAYMKTLLREKCAGLSVENAYKITDIEKMMSENDTSFLIATEDAVSFMPQVNIDNCVLKKIENGNPVNIKFADKIIEGNVRIYCNNIFFGIGIKKEDQYCIKCMLGGNK
ncbi:MAG: tRNA pseudouridine(55) synthase TruB [Clostridiales bacterium]|nr:tRNA pseudouridine(55) synthase TruB [Clostridiales bacterium]